MMKTYDCVVIGGGASGMVAALEAASWLMEAVPGGDKASPGGALPQILILEKGQRVGKKLLTTGNGQCNLSNRDLSLAHYHGSVAEEGLLEKLLEQHSFSEVEAFWQSLGIDLIEEARGKLYPRSLQASSVLNALRRRMEDLGIQVRCEAEVTAIRPPQFPGTKGFWKDIQSAVEEKKNSYVYQLTLKSGEKVTTRTVIQATGGKASPQLGSDGEGYRLAKGLQLGQAPLRPAICRLKSDGPYRGQLSGLRMTVPVELKTASMQEFLQKTTGEVLFTEEGLSGPAALDLSRKAGELLLNGEKVLCTLDLAEEYTPGELFAMLQERLERLSSWTVEDALEGWLPKKMIGPVLKEAKVDRRVMSGNVDKRMLGRLCYIIKAFPIPVSGLAGFKDAQITVGGVLAGEMTPHLECKRYPGLFLTGEVLDLDGDCGGYNLLFAALSGMTAGEAAAKRVLHG